MQRRNWHEHFRPGALALRARDLAGAADLLDCTDAPAPAAVAVLRVSAIEVALKALCAHDSRGYNGGCALAPLYGDLPGPVRADLDREVLVLCPGLDVRALLLRCGGDLASDAVFCDGASPALAGELCALCAAAVAQALATCRDP